MEGEEQRVAAMVAALQGEAAHKAVVFVSSPQEAEHCVASLAHEGFTAMSFHGRTADRGVAMDEFFNGGAVQVNHGLTALGFLLLETKM